MSLNIDEVYSNPTSIPNQFVFGLYHRIAEYLQYSVTIGSQKINMSRNIIDEYEFCDQEGIPIIPRVRLTKELFLEKSKHVYPLVVKITEWNNGRGKFVVNNGRDLASVLIAWSIFGSTDSCMQGYQQLYEAKGNIWSNLDLIDVNKCEVLVLERYIKQESLPTSYRVVVDCQGRVCYALKLTSEIGGHRVINKGVKGGEDFRVNQVNERFSGIQFEDLLLNPNSLLFINTPEFRSNSGATQIERLSVLPADIEDLIPRLHGLYDQQLFTGLDFMINDRTGQLYFLEANCWPQVETNHFEELSGRNMSYEEIYFYMIDRFYLGTN